MVMGSGFFGKFQKLADNEHLILALLAVIAGVVVAYGAIGFRALIDAAQMLAFVARRHDYGHRRRGRFCRPFSPERRPRRVLRFG